MRIAHSLVITPGLCGLYTTAKEIILAERALGHDAFVVEPSGASKGMSDIDVPIGDLSEADALIDHSGCDGAMLDAGIPIVHLRHGRPLSTFLIEHNGGLNVYSHLKSIGQDARYAAIVTMWSEHVEFLEPLVGRKVDYIPAPVDLVHFSPVGPKHDFGGRGGHRNFVIADMWRDDCIPFEAVHKFLRERKEGDRLHVYGIQKQTSAVKTLLGIVGDSLGEVGWSKDMAPIYRAADGVITCTSIATRVVRESMACGCRITSTVSNDWEFMGEPRKVATSCFSPEASATALLRIVERNMAVV